VRNLGGFAREGYDKNSRHVAGQPRGARGRVAPTANAPGGVWVISTKQARHMMGTTRRRQHMEKHLRARRRTDAAFRAAEESLKALPAGDFSYATMLHVAQTRGAAFRVMHPFYGRRVRAAPLRTCSAAAASSNACIHLSCLTAQPPLLI
jgi:hypothetical protein